MRFASDFAKKKKGYELLARSPLATALATWRVGFCNVFRKYCKSLEELPEHLCTAESFFRFIFLFGVLRILSLCSFYEKSFPIPTLTLIKVFGETGKGNFVGFCEAHLQGERASSSHGENSQVTRLIGLISFFLCLLAVLALDCFFLVLLKLLSLKG